MVLVRFSGDHQKAKQLYQNLTLDKQLGNDHSHPLVLDWGTKFLDLGFQDGFT